MYDYYLKTISLKDLPLLSVASRLERCNLCYVELEKLKCSLPALSRYVFFVKILLQVSAEIQFVYAVLFCRRGGNIAKYAQELNLALQEVSWVSNVHNIWSTIPTVKTVLLSGVEVPWFIWLKDESAGNSCKFVLSGITDPILYLNLKVSWWTTWWLPLKRGSGSSLISGRGSILLLCCLNPNVNLVFLSEVDELIIV